MLHDRAENRVLIMLRARLSPPVAFMLGVGVSLLPALGPLTIAFLLIARRWSLKRQDAPWFMAAVAMGVGGFVSSGMTSGLTAALGIVGAWIAYRTFAELRRVEDASRFGSAASLGLLVGFGVLLTTGLLRSIDAITWSSALSLGEVFAWRSPPVLYGHTMLLLGSAIALITLLNRRMAWTALALSLAGIVVSGSVEALSGWILVAFVLFLIRPGSSATSRWVDLSGLSLIVLSVLVIAPSLGVGTVGFTAPWSPSASSPNLLTGTEVPAGDWWDDRWVDVTTERVVLAGGALTAYEVKKRGEEPWLRLQQLVTLTPGATYTLSGWIDTSGDTVPGFQGWGRAEPMQAPLTLIAKVMSEKVEASVTGPGRLDAADVVQEEGTWQRIAVTFTVDETTTPFTWFVGFTPDARAIDASQGRFAGLMLEASSRVSPYVPGVGGTGLTFGYAREPLWQTAWQGILQQPIRGHGPGRFAETYLASIPGIEAQEFVPAHPHNLLLWVWFERGVFGVLGIVFLVVAMTGRAFRTRDVGLLAVFGAVLIANTFDATLLSGSILFPLAALAGWRNGASARRERDAREEENQSIVRFTLAATDFLAVQALAWWILPETWVGGAGLDGWPISVSWSLLLWPAFTWREGLYPGYGLTAAEELKRQVMASVYATVLFVLALLLVTPPALAGLPSIASFTVAILVTLPLTRAALKRGLSRIGVWGRSVIVLGAGRTGRRIVEALQQTPLDGLHPIAMFDDAGTLHGTTIAGVPVRGSLDDAYPFAERHAVRHVILAVPSLDARRLDRLTNAGGPMIRRVQIIPRVDGIPFEDVEVTELDGLLALEVRRGLASPVARTAKRVGDLVLTLVGGLLASPILAALWLAVRLDSEGPGFHQSERVGQHGQGFACLKFRTMRVDAEEELQRLLTTHPDLRAEYERWHKLQDDPRVTRVGHFLRRTSLDELPQLWNVLRGDMSLVGPRPYLAREMQDLGDAADIILQAKPGITGYWQVSGRNDVTFDARRVMEVHYVRNWSVWWDVVLLAKTPGVVLARRGAEGSPRS